MIEKVKSFLKSDRIVFDSFIGMFVTGIGSVANYLSQVLAGRFLSPKDFGELGALLGFLTVITYPLYAFTYHVIRSVAEATDNEKQLNLSYRLMVNVVFIGLLISIGTLVANGFISSNLNIFHPWAIPFLSVYVLITIIMYPIGSISQGLQKIKTYNVLINLNPVLRLLFTLIFILLGFSFFYALLAPSLAVGITVLIFFIFLVSHFRSVKIEYLNPLRHINLSFWKDTIIAVFPLLIASGLFVLSLQMDIILVRRFFPDERSGFYQALSLIGKSLIHLPSAIITVLYPRLTASLNDMKASTKLLYTSFAVNAVVVFVGFTGVFLFRNMIVNLFFGQTYSSVIPLVTFIGIASVLFTFTNVFYGYYLAYKRYITTTLYAFPILLLYIAVRNREVIIDFLNSYGFSLKDGLDFFVYAYVLFNVVLLLLNIIAYPFHKRKLIKERAF